METELAPSEVFARPSAFMSHEKSHHVLKLTGPNDLREAEIAKILRCNALNGYYALPVTALLSQIPIQGQVATVSIGHVH